jgi:hypothetical protein
VPIFAKIKKRAMFKLLIVLLFAISLISCTDALQRAPENLLPQEKMADVLTELYVAEGMSSSAPLNQKLSTIPRNTFYNSIYKKHGISREQFDASLKYYTEDMIEIDQLYQLVNERLLRMEKELSKKAKVEN